MEANRRKLIYTVIRFISTSAGQEVHGRIGTQLNSLIPGAYEGLRSAGDGFASELSEAGSWYDHRDAIVKYIGTARTAIEEAREAGIDVSVDVAIEPEDLAGRDIVCLRVDGELIRELEGAGVSLEFSVYGGAAGE